MTHVRTQMRQAWKTALDTHLPSGEYRVFASRKSPINHKSQLALVDMRFLNDQTRAEEVMNHRDGDGARIHVGSLYVRVQRSARENDIDDLLDQDEINIIAAVAATDWSDLLEEHPEIMQVNFTDDSSGGNILAGIVLRFDLEYRINRDDPETIID